MGIRRLAKELQLSIGTVSRALNDRPDVNPATRARVKAAAMRSGYVPNQSGRSLRSGRTGMVAIVIPSNMGGTVYDPGLFVVLEGLRQELHERGLDLIMLSRGADEDGTEHLKRIVQRRIVDSVVISQTVPDDPRIAYLQEAGIGYVAFGRSAGIDDYSFVDFDFETMAADAARRFVADGHRRMAIAAGESLLNYQEILVAAFRAEAVRLGLPPEAVRLVPMANGEPTAEGRAIMSAPRAPTAYIATNEGIAIALYRELGGMGHKVGQDVSVVCNFPPFEARSLAPALSYYDADLAAVGRELALRLIAQSPDAVGDETEVPCSKLIPLRFTARQSHERMTTGIPI